MSKEESLLVNTILLVKRAIILASELGLKQALDRVLSHKARRKAKSISALNQSWNIALTHIEN